MSLEGFLILLTQTTIILLGLFTLAAFLRERVRSRLDIALMFGSLALIVLFQWLGNLIGGQPPWMSKLGSLLLVAQPYLLLRLVNQRRPVPETIHLGALAGMVVSWLLVLFSPSPIPALPVVLIVLYMVSIELYAAYVLWQGARLTHGVSHWRLLLAGLGSLLLAVYLISTGLVAVFPQIDPFLHPLSQVFGLASMLAYFFGFATPNWLRRSWQLTELFHFIRLEPSHRTGEHIREKLTRLSIAAERAVAGEVAGVALWDNDQKALHLAATSNPEKAPKIPSLETPGVQKAWKELQPALLRFSSKSYIPAPGEAHPDRRASLLVTPIATQERAWGLLLVYLERVPLFASEDLALLTLFNTQTAMALGYDQLFQEQGILIEQLREFNRRLEAMNQLDRAILAAKSTPKIASEALARLRELVPSQRASVATFNLEKRQGRLIAVNANDKSDLPAGTVLSMDDFPSFGAPSPQRKVSYIENVLAVEQVPPLIERLRDQGIRSIIYTPLVAENRLVGAIALSATEPGAFQSQHLDILREVADQLAIGIQQSRLREELERANEELEQRVADRTAELEKSVQDLHQEIDARQQATEALRVAQDRLKLRATELNTANKELEAFAYSVSHDLRAPLRAIDGFSRILLNKYSPELSDEAQRYLGMVCDNTQQMGQLIDDLLSFSRLSRQAINVQDVDPTALVRMVLRDLQKEQEGRPVEIILRDLPNCQADPGLLKQVFTNLVSNALKFTSYKEKARIEVGCQRIDNEQVYFVKDNGVGFDMAYAGKLFGVFQRLHRAEDFEGTGVGLAIVQRIIHRHGGRVWAEAEVDKGATFFFTIPEKGQEQRIE